MNKNLTIVITASLIAFMATAYFFSHYYFAGPQISVKWPCFICRGIMTSIPTQKPIEKQQVSKFATPTATPDTSYVWNSRIEKLYQTIRIMESGKGTNSNPIALHNKCKAKNMRNQIGYLATPDYCFDNEEHEKLTFSRWIMKREKMTDNQILCYWNQGVVVSSCSYSIHAQQVN
jgi:hypothetical protein